MKTWVGVILVLVTGLAAPLRGDEEAAESSSPPKELPNLLQLDARRAVQEGNRLLLEGKADVALNAYDHAKRLRPEAREIAFDQGLAHYEQREFEQAREAFREVSASGDDVLGHDALYSLGICDHAEGLDSVEEDPQLAMSLLENAMTRYHDVLKKQPDHKGARDANRKAAMMWRELKRQQQQQQQESDSECDNPKEGEKKESEKDQQKQGEQDQKEQESQPSESNEQQEEEQQQQSAQEQEQQEDQQKQQASASEQQEQASREQAERKLREMMQSQRQREKMRRQQVQRLPVSPVDKDW